MAGFSSCEGETHLAYGGTDDFIRVLRVDASPGNAQNDFS